MSGDHSSRQYDIILYGATGYTGKLSAEYLAEHIPINLKWAVSGRSEQKLSKLVEELKRFGTSRLPAIEVASLDKSAQNALARKTRLVISSIGPFHLYGTPVLAACAENGTHYVDCTGEVPWVSDMITKYHATALKNNCTLIPQCGIDSVPADLTTYLLVKTIRSTLNTPVASVILSSHMAMLPSGGTLNTVFTIADTYPIKQITQSMSPFALSPVPHPNPKGSRRRPWTEKVFGVRSVAGLGVQTDALFSRLDRALVGRSWGLFDKGRYYGEKFSFAEYKHTRNVVTGALWHFAVVLASLVLVIPPLKSLIKRLVYQPGEGPGATETKSNELRYRAIAYPDFSSAPTSSNASSSTQSARATAEFLWAGDGYYLTGLLMAEAAFIILQGEGKHQSGIVTPATLGEEYAWGIRKAGVKLRVEMEG